MWKGNESIVRLIIENGADFNATDSYGNNSVLRIAIIKGIRSIVQLLVEKGADIRVGGHGCLLDLASCYGHESHQDT
jgi:ankyrin repeat protein